MSASLTTTALALLLIVTALCQCAHSAPIDPVQSPPTNSSQSDTTEPHTIEPRQSEPIDPSQSTLIDPSQSTSVSPSKSAPVDPVELAKQELAGGLYVLKFFLYGEEHRLTNTVLKFEDDPLRSMSVMLQSYVSLISFVRQQINDSDFVNSEHLRLMEVVMTGVVSDLCAVISNDSNNSIDCCNDLMQFTSTEVGLFDANLIDLTLFTVATTLKAYVEQAEKHVIVDNAQDDQWPENNIRDQDEGLLALLCSVADLNC